MKTQPTQEQTFCGVEDLETRLCMSVSVHPAAARQPAVTTTTPHLTAHQRHMRHVRHLRHVAAMQQIRAQRLAARRAQAVLASQGRSSTTSTGQNATDSTGMFAVGTTAPVGGVVLGVSSDGTQTSVGSAVPIGTTAPIGFGSGTFTGAGTGGNVSVNGNVMSTPGSFFADGSNGAGMTTINGNTIFSDQMIM